MNAKRQILTTCAVACALLCSSCGGTKPAPEPKPAEKTPFYAKEGRHWGEAQIIERRDKIITLIKENWLS